MRTLLACLLSSGAILAQVPAAPHLRLEADVRFLADPVLEGRFTPSRGLDVAARFLATRLQALGWQPGMGDGYLQTFDLEVFPRGEVRFAVTLNGVSLKPGEALLAFNAGPPQASWRLPLAFGGQGLVSPERGRDDFQGLDLKRRAVVVLPGSPWPTAPEAILDAGRMKDLAVGLAGGFVTVAVVPDLSLPSTQWQDPDLLDCLKYTRYPAVHLKRAPGYSAYDTSLVHLMVPPAVFDRALARATGDSFAGWMRRAAAGEVLRPRLLEGLLEIRTEGRPRTDRASNVVAVLPGADPLLKREWVVLMAHYDHLGRDGEKVYGGADDNASGVATVLEVARRLSSGIPPRRSVLILFTCGEENGFVGAGGFVHAPVVPMKDIRAVVNIDMVARCGGTLSAITQNAPAMVQAARQAAAGTGLEVKPDPFFGWRIGYHTDCQIFTRAGIPTVWLHAAGNPDAHSPTDTAEKGDYGRMAAIADVATRLAERFAQDQ